MLRSGGWCKECAAARQKAKRNGEVPARDHENCLWHLCGKSLVGRRRHAKFCSTSCSMKQFRADRPGYQRASMIKMLYGMTIEDFDAMLADQGGVCPICGEGEPEDVDPKKTWWNVDHDHETGAVRGILCGPCNMGIGHLKDQADIVMNAWRYLTRPTAAIHVTPIRQQNRRSPQPTTLTARGARIKRPKD